MRYIINDLYVMCYQRALEVGLDVQWINLEGYEEIDKKCDSLSTSKYGIGLSKSSISECILKHVYEDWCKKKYPFLQTILKNGDCYNLFIHQDPTKSIYCAGNRRQMYIETLQDNVIDKSKCFIIHAIKILQFLLQNNVKLSKERFSIRKIALDHKISI